MKKVDYNFITIVAGILLLVWFVTRSSVQGFQDDQSLSSRDTCPPCPTPRCEEKQCPRPEPCPTLRCKENECPRPEPCPPSGGSPAQFQNLTKQVSTLQNEIVTLRKHIANDATAFNNLRDADKKAYDTLKANDQAKFKSSIDGLNKFIRTLSL